MPPSLICETGTILQDRYRILELVGEGGFGHVYKAQDNNQRNKLVAIKQINLQALSSQEIIEATDSYNREVTLLSKLHHKNLPQIYDHFTDPENWYVVMDFIDGETLEDYLKKARSGHLAVRKVVDIGMVLCDVLQYLHSQQPAIVFRDVKPANIMYTRSRRQIYLIDFGIARQYASHKAKDTGPLGSPGYAAPEQYGRTQTTPQTDIYGLGATLQTLLTGQEPLEITVSGKQNEILSKLPKKLSNLLQQMLERDPQHRPMGMEAVKSRLQAYYEGPPIRRQAQRIAIWNWKLLSNRYLWMIAATLVLVLWVPTPWPYLLLLLSVIAGRLTIGLHQEIKKYRHYQPDLQVKDILTILGDRLKGSAPYVFVVEIIYSFSQYNDPTQGDVNQVSFVYVLILRLTILLCISFTSYAVIDFSIRSLITGINKLRHRQQRSQTVPPLQQKQTQQP